ncbi:hypothetical protein [Hydrogenophaga sp. 5NK40-0174]|uniref:hypothetical protein n=1 Tax=Hydrogenophaga sp. 5NK40-0174 TaxID=3127649 RepID=UPI0033426A90
MTNPSAIDLKRRDMIVGAAAAAAGMLLPMSGWALDTPKGRPILTLSGNIGEPNNGEEARFDMAMLAAMEQHSFITHTPWYDQPRKFTGPRLIDVLDAVKADGAKIKARAINDYAIEIPVSDLKAHDVVLARLLDDKPMAIREKGPLFVIYNFDSSAELRKSTYYERCIWQLKSIQVI